MKKMGKKMGKELPPEEIKIDLKDWVRQEYVEQRIVDMRIFVKNQLHT